MARLFLGRGFGSLHRERLTLKTCERMALGSSPPGVLAVLAHSMTIRQKRRLAVWDWFLRVQLALLLAGRAVPESN